MRWILMSMAAVGMLGCTVVLLGALAFRSSQANRELAEAVAARRAEPPVPPKPPPQTSTPATNKEDPPADSPTAKPSPKPEAPKPTGPVYDPAFEKVWAECVAGAERTYAKRAETTAKPLAELSPADRAEALRLMAEVDANPYSMMPVHQDQLFDLGLFVWAMHTGAWASLTGPEYKVVAAGLWNPTLGPQQLFGMGGQFAAIKPSLRQAIADVFQRKVAPADLTPRIRYEIVEMQGETWVGPRTFEQVWADLNAAAEHLVEKEPAHTQRTLMKLPMSARVQVEQMMKQVAPYPNLLSSQQAETLVFTYHLSNWHEKLRMRAAMGDHRFKQMAAILWQNGIDWHDLYGMARRFYWEDLADRTTITQYVINNVSTRKIPPAIREKIADLGGQKWLDR